MMAWLRAGEVDLIMETPFSAITYEGDAGGQILMRAWKSGVPSYRTVFVAHKDGEVSSLADLASRVVAFEDAGSTSGFFVPLTTLLDRGMTVTADEDGERTEAPNAVRYVFDILAGAEGIGLAGPMANLVPVTLGNIVGGGVFVALVYWLVYLAGQERAG